jgi:hypothetical protein
MGDSRKQKKKFYSEDPHCRKCGVLTWMPPEGFSFKKGELSKEQIDTMATIGHKYGRFDDRRYSESSENKPHRLLCHKCNQEEQLEESSKIPIEELRRRSARSPNYFKLLDFEGDTETNLV